MSDTFDFGSGPVPAHRHPNGGGWVADSASVAKTAYVGCDAQVFGSAKVFDSAVVSGDAEVFDSAQVFGDAEVFDSAQVFGSAQVFDSAQVFGSAQVFDSAVVFGDAEVFDSAQVFADAMVSGSAQVSGSAVVSEQFLANFIPLSPVPSLDNIDGRILAAVSEPNCCLRMACWHICKTSHCRAGWAIHLAGEVGYALERECGSWLAGALIYQASRPGMPLPNFFASDEEAMADLRACAAKEGVT